MGEALLVWRNACHFLDYCFNAAKCDRITGIPDDKCAFEGLHKNLRYQTCSCGYYCRWPVTGRRRIIDN